MSRSVSRSGRRWTCTTRFSPRTRVTSPISCTTARRTLTAPFTSGTRSTRSSRISSSSTMRSAATTRPTSPVGTVMACLSRTRSRKNSVLRRWQRSMCRPSARSVVSMPKNRSMVSARASSVWAFRATGAIPISPSIPSTRRATSRFSRICTFRGRSIEAASPSIGARIATRRLPRQRSSMPTR